MAKNATSRKSGANAEEPVRRWTTKRRTELVLCLLRGETSVQEAARKPGLTVAEFEKESRTSLRGGLTEFWE